MTEPEPISAPESAGTAGAAGPARGRIARVLLAGALVLALAGAGWFARAWEHERALRFAGEDATAAARKAAVAMTTYDYRSVARDFAWPDVWGTARLQQNYATISEPVRRYVVQLQVTATGTVTAAAPEVHDSDHVTVLLFVDQQLRSARGDAAASDAATLVQPRITMRMVHTAGRWLVDEVSLASLSQ